jgi:hypothetical protein
LATCLVSFASLVQGQGVAPLPLRDPTVAPITAGTDTGGTDTSNGGLPQPLGISGSNVVVREGKSYLVVGSRLVAPGQTVENFKLERITETEIWLRDATGLTKVSRFAGVQRQAAPTQCPAAKPTPSPKPAKKKSKIQLHKAQPPNSKTGADAPRPIRENDPHDC